jgi:hypothetical protein
MRNLRGVYTSLGVEGGQARLNIEHPTSNIQHPMSPEAKRQKAESGKQKVESRNEGLSGSGGLIANPEGIGSFSPSKSRK